jgi:hypothetical protein
MRNSVKYDSASSNEGHGTGHYIHIENSHAQRKCRNMHNRISDVLGVKRFFWYGASIGLQCTFSVIDRHLGVRVSNINLGASDIEVAPVEGC